VKPDNGGKKMIVNGNYYPNTANNTYTAEADSVSSLAEHLGKAGSEQAKAGFADRLELSPEAYAALKEYAPEALDALGYDSEDPILEEVKEMAKEKYFHFGSQYLKLPDTQDEMISALDVANRYMDALNSIEPNEIYDQIAEANAEDSGDFISMANRYGAQALLGW